MSIPFFFLRKYVSLIFERLFFFLAEYNELTGFFSIL